ncbi:hypothetical protein BAE44_0004168, partial [Dichanthelium oligosanthes]
EYSTRDLVEEYRVVGCFPIRAGWEVSFWNQPRGSILVPDFMKSFDVQKEAIKPEWAEVLAHFILGVEAPKEWKDNVQRLGGTRTNRVFESFGIKAPLRNATLGRLEKKGKDKKNKTAEGGVAAPVATAKLENMKRGRAPSSKRLRKKSTSPSGGVGDETELGDEGESDGNSRGGPKAPGTVESAAVTGREAAGQESVASPQDPQANIAVAATLEGATVEAHPGETRSSEAPPKLAKADGSSTSPLGSAKVLSAAGKLPFVIEYSDLEPESDEEEDVNATAVSVGKAIVPHDADVDLSPRRPTGEDLHPNPDAPRASADDVSSTENIGTQSESSLSSSAYFVSDRKPDGVAASLGVGPKANLFGGQVCGLQFQSSNRERQMLEEAGSSFFFPIMEAELEAAGIEEALQNSCDLLPPFQNIVSQTF